jgi:hypothetical protein
VNRDLVSELGRRYADHRIPTVDEDDTIIESHKQEAKATYEGSNKRSRGYQPMMSVWAETNVILADEFRDGNVPAPQDPLNVAQAASAALPSTANEFYYRDNSACHEYRLLDWLRNA